MKIYQTLFQIFSEKKCQSCLQPWHFFCPQCRESLFRYKPYCYVCKKASDNFMIHEKCKKELPLQQVIVMTRYKIPVIQKLLKHAKYYGKYQIYNDIIPNNIAQYINTSETLQMVLVPIPMHFFRRWKRWYNHTEKIANIISKITGLLISKRLVTKKNYTKHQSKLSRTLRINNVRWSYYVIQKCINKDQTIYLVDDVVSSGSTLREVALILQASWYIHIRAIVIASD